MAALNPNALNLSPARLKMLAASLCVSGLLAACATQPNEAHSAHDAAQPAAQAKIAAGQEGSLSPVPAFMGGGAMAGGAGWRIDIQATGNMQHKFSISGSDGVVKATGTLAYKGPVADAASSLIVLSGQRDDIQNADNGVIVEIQPKSCTDAAGQVHMHSVAVYADSLSALGMNRLQGCGDLAVY